MSRWMRTTGGRVLACVGAVWVMSLVGCGTMRGVGEDLSRLSDSTRTAVFGGDPDGAPID